MVDLDRLHLAPKLIAPAIAAVVALIVLEVGAYVGYDQSPAARNAFGYSKDTAFSVDESVVRIAPASSRRFWAQRYPLIAAEGIKRVVLVGDSAARGPSLEGSISEALRRQLDSQCGMRVEVWNLSSPGYGSRRKDLVVEKALEFSPDLVVYAANVSTEYEDNREWERYVEYHSWHPRRWVDQLPFLGRVKLSKVERWYWEWLPEEVRVASLEEPLAIRIAAIASKFDTRYWTPLMLSNLDRTVDQVRRAEVPMLILVQSHLEPDTRQVTDAGLDEKIESRYARRAGVAVASSRALLTAHSDVTKLFRDSSHWTDAGKEVIAGGLIVPASRLLGNQEHCRRPGS